MVVYIIIPAYPGGSKLFSVFILNAVERWPAAFKRKSASGSVRTGHIRTFVFALGLTLYTICFVLGEGYLLVPSQSRGTVLSLSMLLRRDAHYYWFYEVYCA
jgi:hypothetical protein